MNAEETRALLVKIDNAIDRGGTVWARARRAPADRIEEVYGMYKAMIMVRIGNKRRTIEPSWVVIDLPEGK